MSDYEFHLMLAYYHEGNPYIFSIQSKFGIAERQQKYATLGCGATVAEYILSTLKPDEMSGILCITTAVFVVEEVKKVDAFCGGPMRVGTISPRHVNISNQHHTDAIVKNLEAVAAERKEALSKLLFGTLEKTAKELGYGGD